jgi:hypothetical protein
MQRLPLRLATGSTPGREVAPLAALDSGLRHRWGGSAPLGRSYQSSV